MGTIVRRVCCERARDTMMCTRTKRGMERIRSVVCGRQSARENLRQRGRRDGMQNRAANPWIKGREEERRNDDDYEYDDGDDDDFEEDNATTGLPGISLVASDSRSCRCRRCCHDSRVLYSPPRGFLFLPFRSPTTPLSFLVCYLARYPASLLSRLYLPRVVAASLTSRPRHTEENAPPSAQLITLGPSLSPR